MEIYLPIAEMSVRWLVILGMGGAVGFLSGMLGVGGGFLLTPLLIFYGIPAEVAVAYPLQRNVIESLGAESVGILELNLEDAFIEYTRGPRRSLPLFATELENVQGARDQGAA